MPSGKILEGDFPIPSFRQDSNLGLSSNHGSSHALMGTATETPDQKQMFLFLYIIYRSHHIIGYTIDKDVPSHRLQH